MFLVYDIHVYLEGSKAIRTVRHLYMNLESGRKYFDFFFLKIKKKI